jgi:hypothetical protein
MKITQKYSHLNGEEYLIVHHKNLYDELIAIIDSIDGTALLTKVSKEKTMMGEMLFNPIALNRAFINAFREKNWYERRYKYYLTTDRKLMQEIVPLPYEQQKEHLQANGIQNPLSSFKQTDFVKNEVAVEVQFGKYAFVAFDLFVKHLLFYSGGIINVGIEILPTKNMQNKMSSGVAYYEGEVYNVLRHGRGNPPVPLLILGIEA